MLIVDYYIKDEGERKRTIEVEDADPLNDTETDLIESFYHKLFRFRTLTCLERFFILNLNKHYTIVDEGENLETKIYYVALAERHLNRAEAEMEDCYKTFIQARKELIEYKMNHPVKSDSDLS